MDNETDIESILRSLLRYARAKESVEMVLLVEYAMTQHRLNQIRLRTKCHTDVCDTPNVEAHGQTTTTAANAKAEVVPPFWCQGLRRGVSG